MSLADNTSQTLTYTFSPTGAGDLSATVSAQFENGSSDARQRLRAGFCPQRHGRRPSVFLCHRRRQRLYAGRRHGQRQHHDHQHRQRQPFGPRRREQSPGHAIGVHRKFRRRRRHAQPRRQWFADLDLHLHAHRAAAIFRRTFPPSSTTANPTAPTAPSTRISLSAARPWRPFSGQKVSPPA